MSIYSLIKEDNGEYSRKQACNIVNAYKFNLYSNINPSISKIIILRILGFSMTASFNKSLATYISIDSSVIYWINSYFIIINLLL